MRRLADIAKRFTTRSDQDLTNEIERVRAERRTYARSAGTFREDAHAAIDTLVETAREEFQAVAGSVGHHLSANVDEPVTSRLVRLHIAGSRAFAEELRQAVGRAPAGVFTEVTRAQYQSKLDGYERKIHELEVELERRRLARESEATEAALASLTDEAEK